MVRAVSTGEQRSRHLRRKGRESGVMPVGIPSYNGTTAFIEHAPALIVKAYLRATVTTTGSD
jgi:hypothetical protein